MVTPEEIERKIMSGEYATFMAAVCGITRMKGASESERTRLKELARKHIRITMAPRRRRDAVEQAEAPGAPQTAALTVYGEPRLRKLKDPYAKREELLGKLAEVDRAIADEQSKRARKAFSAHMESMVSRAREEVLADWDTVSREPRESLFEIARSLLASLEAEPNHDVAARLIGVVCSTLEAKAA